MEEHNYIKKLNRLINDGTIPKGTSVTEVYFSHADGCGIFKAKRCNCDPDVILKTIDTQV